MTKANAKPTKLAQLIQTLEDHFFDGVFDLSKLSTDKALVHYRNLKLLEADLEGEKKAERLIAAIERHHRVVEERKHPVERPNE